MQIGNETHPSSAVLEFTGGVSHRFLEDSSYTSTQDSEEERFQRLGACRCEVVQQMLATIGEGFSCVGGLVREEACDFMAASLRASVALE